VRRIDRTRRSIDGSQPALQISVMFGHPSAFFVVLELHTCLASIIHVRRLTGQRTSLLKKPNKSKLGILGSGMCFSHEVV
jgi:hypothetical protein